MHRSDFRHQNLTFSYLDSGGPGPILIALHGHWMEGATFTPLASALLPHWRLIALDQRGHGYTSHAESYTRTDYVGDVKALYEHLGITEAVMLGHSLGGVNAYQFAAQHQERVRGLIIEEIGAENAVETPFVLQWGGVFPTREALADAIGLRFSPYLVQSFRETPEGWKLAFDPREVVTSQRLLNGDHWKDWLATTCPALLIRGAQSRVTTAEHLEVMAARRPHTTLVTFDGGHVVHADDPAGFADVVNHFLNELR